MCRLLGFVQRISRPLMRGYEVVDKWTFGLAKHLVLLVVGISLYYALTLSWAALKYLYVLVFAGGAAAAEQAASAPAAASVAPQAPLDPALDAAKKWAAQNARGDEFDF